VTRVAVVGLGAMAFRVLAAKAGRGVIPPLRRSSDRSGLLGGDAEIREDSSWSPEVKAT
jgi:hypothetical protein